MENNLTESAGSLYYFFPLPCSSFPKKTGMTASFFFLKFISSNFFHFIWNPKLLMVKLQFLMMKHRTFTIKQLKERMSKTEWSLKFSNKARYCAYRCKNYVFWRFIKVTVSLTNVAIFWHFKGLFLKLAGKSLLWKISRALLDSP